MSVLSARLQLVTLIVAASYMTLCISDLRAAERLAVWYGTTTLILALLNVVAERRHGRR